MIWGLLLQFLLGLIILRWEVGKQVFQCLGEKITTFLGYTEEGSSFVYGYLVSEKPGVFMFSILSVIFFFGFITSMLFYMGYMQWLIAKIGNVQFEYNTPTLIEPFFFFRLGIANDCWNHTL